MTDLDVENESKISLISKQKLAKYMESKNTVKTVLGCLEAEIINFLCFDHSECFGLINIDLTYSQF